MKRQLLLWNKYVSLLTTVSSYEGNAAESNFRIFFLFCKYIDIVIYKINL
jgi:hypothetical protein